MTALKQGPTNPRDLRIMLACMALSACISISGMVGLAMWIHG